MTLLLLSVLVLLVLQVLLVPQVQAQVLVLVLQLVLHLMWRVGLLLLGVAQGGQHHLHLEGVKILCPSIAKSALKGVWGYCC